MAVDEFTITFRPHGNTPDQYLAMAWHSRLPVIGGIFKTQQTFSAAEARAINEEYQHQLRLAHELADLDMKTPPAPDRTPLLNLGHRIATVLPEATRNSLVQAASRARHQHRRLRISLNFYPTALVLLSIPWELMVLPLQVEHALVTEPEDFLLIDPQISMVRRIEGVGLGPANWTIRPLRVQIFAAQPVGSAPINLGGMRQAFEKTPVALSGSTWYTGSGTLGAIQTHMQQAPSIVQLICHGEGDHNQRVVRHDLLLTHTNGHIRRVSGPELGPILTANRNLQCVLLHACHSGQQTADAQRHTSESVALSLLRRDVSLVVAFQGEVSQLSSEEWIIAFYTALAAGEPIDVALGSARHRMWAAGHLFDWSLPVLYCGSEQPESLLGLNQWFNVLESAVQNPLWHRIARGSMLIAGLSMLLVALIRLLVAPAIPLTVLRTEINTLLTVALLMGVVGPGCIAASYRQIYRTTRLTPRVRIATILSQWSGAYLGYALGYVTGLMSYVMSFLVLGSALKHLIVQQLVIIALVGWSLLSAYLGMRMVIRSALALAEKTQGLFGRQTTAVIFGAVLILTLGVSWWLQWLIASGDHVVLQPASLALVLAIVLIMSVLRPQD